MNPNINNEKEILIVEDSATQAEMLKFLLEKRDYHVYIANNGKEALEKINMRKPAIIISDIVMPEMDGFELCRHIKETEKLQDIPVILLTALSDAKDVLKGLECGANNFITKPYEEKYLVSTVQSMLANRLPPEMKKTQSGIRISFSGQEYFIAAQPQQILTLLLSTYETAVQKNLELQKVQDELMNLTLELESKVEKRTIELKVANDKLSQDITRRKVAETERAQVNRALRMLSDTNQALIHVTDEGTLLNEVCRIGVDVGGYRMAWIGFAEHDEAKTLRPVAHAGFESGYIESARVTWADNERGRGPGGTAIRTGQPGISRNILLDMAFAPWREAVIQHGYKSIIALPLISEGQTLGALGIYSVEKDAFDTKEVEILKELGDDLAFGITSLRTRAIRDQAEEELKKYRDHLEELVNERTASLTTKTNELNRANIKLKELDKLKSMFIASMSHELRTPLNSIIGFSGMTLQGLSGELNEEQRDNLTRINRSAEHLLSLITDIIDISKIEAGRVEVFPEHFSLHELIAEAVITIQSQAKQKGLALEVDVPTDIKMNTDRKRLLQCLINYMSNAVKFTEVGKLTILARRVNGDVEISVIDTGIGIAEKNMPQLFEAFERLESHLKLKAGGTGLGLYLTKKMATELLRGGVGVESIVGKGSTFSLRIPEILRNVGETK